MTGTDDAALRAARRRIARELHPDRGGDTDAYLAALAALEERHTQGTAAPVTGRRRLLPSRRRLHRAVRAVQHRLPRRLPGARRWARI